MQLRGRGETQHFTMKQLLIVDIFILIYVLVYGWRGPGLIIQSFCPACRSLSSDTTLWADGRGASGSEGERLCISVIYIADTHTETARSSRFFLFHFGPRVQHAVGRIQNQLELIDSLRVNNRIHQNLTSTALLSISNIFKFELRLSFRETVRILAFWLAYHSTLTVGVKGQMPYYR